MTQKIQNPTHLSIIVCLALLEFCKGIFHPEFGNVLRQEMVTVKSTDPDVQRVIEHARLYVLKRQPWSLPSSKDLKSPEVPYLSKMRLVYTHDNVEPLYYDDTVRDKMGHQYGVTSFITLGNTYKLRLSWRRKNILFSHNFTVSDYPNNHLNIYMHTYFVTNLNASNVDKSSNRQFLLPKLGSSFFQYTSENSEQIGQYSYPKHDLDTESAQEFHSNQLYDSNGNKINMINKDVKAVDEDIGIESLTIMTYNIWNFNSRSTKFGGYTERMHRLKNTILQADPDIIALQEVRYEELKGEDLGPNQIQILSEWLPQYQYVYQPAQMQPNTFQDGRTEEGVAIMSKFPILSHNCVMLFINRSNSADTHQRVLLHVEVFLPSIGRLNVLTTHLSLSHEAREQSVVQIWNYVKSLPGPAVILGDFNAEPMEKAMMYMIGKEHLPRAGQSQLVDVWASLKDQDQDGFTFNALERNLTKRIDYIFFKPWEDCCLIESCSVLDDGTRGVRAASDHVPVMATFSKRQKHSSSIKSNNER